jgi:ADP-ribosylglycohydrolase
LRSGHRAQTLVEILGNGTEAHKSVPTASMFSGPPELVDKAVTYAVRLGGDADTIGR